MVSPTRRIARGFAAKDPVEGILLNIGGNHAYGLGIVLPSAASVFVHPGVHGGRGPRRRRRGQRRNEGSRRGGSGRAEAVPVRHTVGVSLTAAGAVVGSSRVHAFFRFSRACGVGEHACSFASVILRVPNPGVDPPKRSGRIAAVEERILQVSWLWPGPEIHQGSVRCGTGRAAESADR